MLNTGMAYMNSSVCFEQRGIIESVHKNRITVRIDRASACGSCSAKGMCNLAESAESLIEIDDSTQLFSVGEWVRVSMSRSMGNKAILFGYFIPFVLLISTLLIVSACGLPEWIAGLLSLLILVPWYIVLYIFRERLRKTFTFSIHKTA
jgi:sigma-E factor negative regulatory protein RseC